MWIEKVAEISTSKLWRSWKTVVPFLCIFICHSSILSTPQFYICSLIVQLPRKCNHGCRAAQTSSEQILPGKGLLAQTVHNLQMHWFCCQLRSPFMWGWAQTIKPIQILRQFRCACAMYLEPEALGSWL